jgi:hypothetical protein
VPITLNGRQFEAVSSGTVEWDVTLYGLLQGAGLSDVTMHAGETPQRLAERIYRSLIGCGRLFEILGCVLVPAGTQGFKWTPELMQSTAEFLRHLQAPEDKEAITAQMVALVTSFFRQGLLSIRTSPSSSGASVGAAATATATATQSAAREANSTTASGA